MFLSFFHPAVLFLLFAILLSFVAIILICHYIKPHQEKFDYQPQYDFFQNISQISLKPQSLMESLAYLGLFSIILFLLWNNLYPVGIKHFDAISYIELNVCNLNPIHIHLSESHRFFPMAAQEWNLLAPIMSLSDCSFYIPYALVSIQFIITIYLLIKIIPFQNLFYRLFAAAFIIGNSAFLIPFTNLVIHERNVLFLIVLFLYFYIKFYQTKKFSYIIYALCAANASLYFKEPTFLLVSGFAGTMLLINIFQNKIQITDILKQPISFIKKHPIESMLLISSFIFSVLYILYTKILFSGQEVYAAAFFQINYIGFIIKRLFINPYPLFWLTLIMPLIYLIDYKNYQKNSFSIALFVGGLCYLILLTIFRLDKLYFYALPTLCMMLAACFYLNNLSLPKKAHRKLLISVLALFILSAIPFTLKNLNYNIGKEKIRQSQRLDLTKTFQHDLSLNLDSGSKIFYYIGTTNDPNQNRDHIYWHDIIGRILHLAVNDNDIHITSICLKHNVQNCIATKDYTPDDYDVSVFWQDIIPKAEWQKLKTQYGDQMEKITHFPKWIQWSKEDKGHHIYIINNF